MRQKCSKKCGKRIVIEVTKKEGLEQQYFFPGGKRGVKIVNEIFNEEFFKEIFIDHYPGFRRETLFRIGEEENIHHYPRNVKGQTIIVGGFDKYFTLELTLKSLKMNILRRLRKWETVISLKIPLIKPVKIGLRKWRDLNGSYTIRLVISTFDLFIQFTMKKDVFEKYRKFEEQVN